MRTSSINDGNLLFPLVNLSLHLFLKQEFQLLVLSTGYAHKHTKFILICCDCLLDKMIIEMKAFKIDSDIHYRNALITELFINLYKMIIS